MEQSQRNASPFKGSSGQGGAFETLDQILKSIGISESKEFDIQGTPDESMLVASEAVSFSEVMHGSASLEGALRRICRVKDIAVLADPVPHYCFDLQMAWEHLAQKYQRIKRHLAEKYVRENRNLLLQA